MSIDTAHIKYNHKKDGKANVSKESYDESARKQKEINARRKAQKMAAEDLNSETQKVNVKNYLSTGEIK